MTLLWLTGLPGSGKSSISKAFVAVHPEFEILSMDTIREDLSENPTYTEEERENSYHKLAGKAKELTDQGKSILIDATAHKAEYRAYAKTLMPDLKIVYVRCALEKAMHREAQREDHPVIKHMYEDALKRVKGEQVEKLGDVIGVDVPYEEPENPDLILDTENTAEGEDPIQKNVQQLEEYLNG